MNQPPQRPKTILTRLMQNGADRIQFAKIKLKENARVPELRIQGPDDTEPKVYPLLGEKFTLGRSSKTSDIVIPNPVVSTTHAVVSRDRKPRKILGVIPGRQRFVIRDENSTNGIYKGKNGSDRAFSTMAIFSISRRLTLKVRCKLSITIRQFGTCAFSEWVCMDWLEFRP